MSETVAEIRIDPLEAVAAELYRFGQRKPWSDATRAQRIDYRREARVVVALLAPPVEMKDMTIGDAQSASYYWHTVWQQTERMLANVQADREALLDEIDRLRGDVNAGASQEPKGRSEC